MIKKLIKLSSGIKEMTGNEVFIQFQGMLHNITRKYLKPNLDYEELFQVASVGLAMAYNSYDISKDVCFSTFLVPVVRNRLSHYFRDTEFHFDDISLDEEVQMNKDGKPMSLLEIIPDDFCIDDIAIDNLDFIDVRRIMGQIDDKYRNIIEMYYFRHKTQDEIAKILNYSQVRISRYLKQGIKQIKNIYFGGSQPMSKWNKENIMAFFNQNSNLKKVDMVNLTSSKFGMPIKTVEFYYYQWKKEFTETKTDETNKSSTEKTNVTTKDLWKFFEENIKYDKEKVMQLTIEKFNITAKDAKEAYSFWRNDYIKSRSNVIDNTKPDNQTTPAITKGATVVSDTITKTNIPASKKINSLLKPTTLEGALMTYKLAENSVSIQRPNGNSTLMVQKSEIDSFIAELSELKNVV